MVEEVGQAIELGEGRTGCVGSSIGVVRFPELGKEFAELLNLADVGMYKVKNAGRNGFSIYDGKDYETTILPV